MAEIVNDEVFGEMTYEYGWRKKQSINILGQKIEVEIIANAYSGDSIIETQRNSYKWFLGNIKSLDENILNAVIEYAKKNASDISERIFNNKVLLPITIENIDKFLKPTSILFDRDDNSTIGILCDCKWEMEDGFAIKIENKNIIKMGTQDIIL
ncbi:DUF6985 domain-containing protein [Clostridium butyricum]|uniref:DUF6985 domain-containing protein n=1 Tax=Clostridium butyricum TaxID=1492 RepID=UPI0024BAEB8C|nr:hypothetical protein [Clostridium butyricum]